MRVKHLMWSGCTCSTCVLIDIDGGMDKFIVHNHSASEEMGSEDRYHRDTTCTLGHNEEEVAGDGSQCSHSEDEVVGECTQSLLLSAQATSVCCRHWWDFDKPAITGPE